MPAFWPSLWLWSCGYLFECYHRLLVICPTLLSKKICRILNGPDSCFQVPTMLSDIISFRMYFGCSNPNDKSILFVIQAVKLDINIERDLVYALKARQCPQILFLRGQKILYREHGNCCNIFFIHWRTFSRHVEIIAANLKYGCFNMQSWELQMNWFKWLLFSIMEPKNQHGLMKQL